DIGPKRPPLETSARGGGSVRWPAGAGTSGGGIEHAKSLWLSPGRADLSQCMGLEGDGGGSRRIETPPPDSRADAPGAEAAAAAAPQNAGRPGRRNRRRAVSFRAKPMSFAGLTQLVECQLPKLDVAGSNPVSRSGCLRARRGVYASLARGATRVACQKYSQPF